MKSRKRSSQGKEKATARANRMKWALDLTSNPNFIEDYGIWHSTGNPASYVSYTHLGYEIRLRFSQDAEWKATCPHFDIQTSFPNQTPDQIQNILNDWLMAHIECPVTPDARLRSNRTAVQDLAARHGIGLALGLEVYDERGF